MKFTKLIVNGKKVVEELPVAWHQVTFRQYHRMAEHGDSLDDASTISVFTGIDPDTIRNARIKNYENVISLLSFMKTPPVLYIPDRIKGYEVPRMLEAEAAARYADIQEITAKFTEDKIANLKSYPLIVATYVSPSPYSIKSIDTLAEYLWDAPCSEVMATGNFILTKLAASRNGTLSSSPQEGTPVSRWKLDMINWLRLLVSRTRSGIWRKSRPLHERNFLNGR